MNNDNNNYRLTLNEGDMAVSNDLRVGGRLLVNQHARCKRDLHVEGTLFYRHLKGMDCGVHAGVDQLLKAQPSPSPGQWALVGDDTDDMALYGCVTLGQWTLMADHQTLARQVGEVTLDRAPQIQQYVDSLVLDEKGERTAADADLHEALDIMDQQMVRGLRINGGSVVYPDSEGILQVNYASERPEANQPSGKPETDIPDTPGIPSDNNDPSGGDDPSDNNDPSDGDDPSDNNDPSGGDEPSDAADPRYPEYYGAKGDGIAFYDWPLRCFNGVVDGVVDGGAIDKEVFAPSERIWHPAGFAEEFDLTTADVCYDSSRKAFVVKCGDTYYTTWNNAADWNDTATGQARTDCVFSDISPVDEEFYGQWPAYAELKERNDSLKVDAADDAAAGYLKRVSYVVRDGQLVDIHTLMTDDTDAIYACALANKGSLRLHDKVYYMGTVGRPYGSSNRRLLLRGWKPGVSRTGAVATNPWYRAGGFTVDGGGGTLFVRTCWTHVAPQAITGSSTMGNVHLFSLHETHDGTFKNLRRRALRDFDNGAPGGHDRFSSSDSRMVAFALHGGDAAHAVHHLRFENVDLDGMMEDYNCSSYHIHDIDIDGWKSRRVNQNAFRGGPWSVRNADVEQVPYCGGGLHLLYGQTFLHDIDVEDSHLRQGGKYVPVMLDFANNLATGIPTGIRFRRCRLEGGTILQGSGYSDGTDSVIRIEDCLVRQIWSEAHGVGTVDGVSTHTRVNVQSAFVPSYSSLYLENTTLWTLPGKNALGYRGTTKAGQVLSVTNCDFFCERDGGGSAYLLSGWGTEGTQRWRGVRTNYFRRGGGSAGANIGDMRMATDQDTLAEMAEGLCGKRCLLPLRVAGPTTAYDAPVTLKGTLAIDINDDEQVTLDVDTTVQSGAELTAYLGTRLDEAGYGGLWTRKGSGSVYLVLSSRLGRRTTLAVGDDIATAGSLGEGSPRISIQQGSTGYNFYAGADPKWMTVERLEAGADDGGTQRPADAAVGHCFFDATLGKPVWVQQRKATAQGIALTWVDATGTVA